MKKNNTKKKKRIFGKKDFYSGDGFVTSVWGPPTWHLLHTISFNYPVNPTKEQKEHYRNFILNFQNVLPCGACRKNLTNNFKELPLTMKDMESRDTFSKYIYKLHEHVNKMLNKTSNLTYCDVRERYEHFRARCTDPKPKVFEQQELHKISKGKTRRAKKEKGCTEPLYGKKSRCILKIVPQDEKGQSIQIDKKCNKTR